MYAVSMGINCDDPGDYIPPSSSLVASPGRAALFALPGDDDRLIIPDYVQA